MYRQGDATFTDEEFELARRFADAAALALDNAHVRARLEHQAQTDSLTGLYNHRYFHERLRSELRRVSRAHDAVVGADARHRRLQARQRRPRARRRRRGALRARGRALADRARLRRRLSARRRGVRGDPPLVRRGGGARPRQPAHRATRGDRSRPGRQGDRLDRARARAEARDEPARADRLRRGGDDDRQGPRQEPDRVLRGRRDRAAGHARGRRPHRALDRAHEDAAEPQRQAQPPQRRAPDRAHDRERAALADRLPQLPRVRRGRRGRGPGRLPWRARRPGADHARGAGLQARRRRHGPGRTDRRVSPPSGCGPLRVRGVHPRYRPDRRVVPRGAAPLRLPGDRRRRALETRPRPVRRGRPPSARGARRPRLGRARERAPLRGRAPRGGERARRCSSSAASSPRRRVWRRFSGLS